MSLLLVSLCGVLLWVMAIGVELWDRWESVVEVDKNLPILIGGLQGIYLLLLKYEMEY
jgi:hypothetical protein